MNQVDTAAGGMHQAMIGGPALTNWLAIIGMISLIYWAWRITVALSRRNNHPEAQPTAAVAPIPAAVPRAASAGPSPQDIAVIVAAIAATVGAHRIVHLQTVPGGQEWAAEGRWMHQTSHRPG